HAAVVAWLVRLGLRCAKRKEVIRPVSDHRSPSGALVAERVSHVQRDEGRSGSAREAECLPQSQTLLGDAGFDRQFSEAAIEASSRALAQFREQLEVFLGFLAAMVRPLGELLPSLDELGKLVLVKRATYLIPGKRASVIPGSGTLAVSHSVFAHQARKRRRSTGVVTGVIGLLSQNAAQPLRNADVRGSLLGALSEPNTFSFEQPPHGR